MAGDKDGRGWHLDRGLNPAYIVPLLSAILAGLAWAGSVNSGQAKQDEKILAVENKVVETDRRTREDMKEIRDSLKELLGRKK